MANRTGIAAISGVAFYLATAASAAGSTPLAQWNMDETFGTTMHDSSGNHNDGAMKNVVTSGGGFMFNGTSSKVIVPNSASLDPTGDFSFTVQVQTDRIPPSGGDYDVLRKGAATTIGGGYRMEIENSKGIAKAYCQVKDSLGHGASIRGKTNIADGKLHTISCIKRSTGLTLQVDDLAPLTKTASLTGPIKNTKELVLGVKAPKATGSDADFYYGTMRSASVTTP